MDSPVPISDSAVLPARPSVASLISSRGSSKQPLTCDISDTMTAAEIRFPPTNNSHLFFRGQSAHTKALLSLSPAFPHTEALEARPSSSSAVEAMCCSLLGGVGSLPALALLVSPPVEVGAASSSLSVVRCTELWWPRGGGDGGGEEEAGTTPCLGFVGLESSTCLLYTSPSPRD